MGMGMGYSLGHRLVLKQVLKQSLNLSYAVRLEYKLNLRLAIIESVHGTRFDPYARCNCNYHLKPIEILQGFLPDPNDYTTQCPKCKSRFVAKLLGAVTDYGRVELAFYCAMQTLAKLPDIASLDPGRIKKQFPAVYHSAVLHFGTLKSAFVKAEIEYPFVEVFDWKDKIRPYLGTLPDTEIARYVGVSSDRIGKLRRSLQISRYTPEKLKEWNEENIS